METRLFTPYHIALLAKQKGFDEPCVAKLMSAEDSAEIGQVFTNSSLEKLAHAKCVATPTYQQLVDWLRVKHSILITTQPHITGAPSDEYYGVIQWTGVGLTETPVRVGYYTAFDYTLEKVLKEL